MIKGVDRGLVGAEAPKMLEASPQHLGFGIQNTKHNKRSGEVIVMLGLGLGLMLRNVGLDLDLSLGGCGFGLQGCGLVNITALTLRRLLFLVFLTSTM